MARGLRKRFGSTVALDGLDLQVDAGTIVGLVGPNGSGKTTALGIAAGLVSPEGGDVLVCGAPAGSRIARSSLALIPDEPAGFDELTVTEYASLVRALYGGGAAARQRLEVLVEAFGLTSRRNTRLGGLSRGLRRQASAVAGLSLATPVLLVDEASATLDPEAVVVLKTALRAHARRGGAVLVATQDLRFAETTCDLVAVLRRGRVVELGAPEQLARLHGVDDLEAVFLDAIGERSLPERVRGSLASL